MNLLSTKIQFLIIFISLFVIVSCNNTEIVYPEGGYNYPNHFEDKDTTFYFYPLKDILSTKDSFETVNSYSFLHGFDEYNLSLRPNDKPILRLTYYGGPTAVITLSPEEIIVKEFIKGSWGYVGDTTKLSNKEKFHFDILERFFPLNDTSHKKWRKIYLDSLSATDPELLDPNYYKYLLEKTGVFSKSEFGYSSKRISINKKTFDNILDQINKSGFWQLAFDNWCANYPTDASGFLLEANTPKKYNVVKSISCPDDSTKFTKACQEIIKYAKMDGVIHLIWDGSVTTDTPYPIKIRELKLTEIKEDPLKKKKRVH